MSSETVHLHEEIQRLEEAVPEALTADRPEPIEVHPHVLGVLLANRRGYLEQGGDLREDLNRIHTSMTNFTLPFALEAYFEADGVARSLRSSYRRAVRSGDRAEAFALEGDINRIQNGLMVILRDLIEDLKRKREQIDYLSAGVGAERAELRWLERWKNRCETVMDKVDQQPS